MKVSKAIVSLAAALLTVIPGRLAKTYAAPNPQSAPTATPAPGSKPTVSLPATLPKGKKLVLMDGTFQLVREYSVEGDRVRYWSLERSAWEEIPKSLVDWDATQKAEADQTKQEDVLKAKLHATEVQERTQDINVDRSLEIKPGLFLPDDVGFYALEDKRLIGLKQSETVTKTDMGREVTRILSGVPLIPAKQNVFLAGPRATLRLTTAEPEFFMRPADDREPRFRLLRMDVKNKNRVVDSISIHMSGEQFHKANEVQFQTWTPAHGVFRYTLNERLEPGEYVFVEMTGEGIDAYVWDFGVDNPDSSSER